MDVAKWPRRLALFMYEVERKAPADLDRVRSVLDRAGATREATVEQSDVYFQHPGRDFAQTDEALRLRNERDVDSSGVKRVVLTYKGPRLETGSKTRREIETGVADPEATTSILTALGFERVCTVEKRRERWSFRGVGVSLDRVTGVGTYVEVELESVPEELALAEKRATDTLEALGIDPSETVQTSYLGFVLERQDEREQCV